MLTSSTSQNLISLSSSVYANANVLSGFQIHLFDPFNAKLGCGQPLIGVDLRKAISSISEPLAHNVQLDPQIYRYKV